MARPTTAPRLSTIDPQQLTNDVEHAAQAHVTDLLIRLGGVHDLPRIPDLLDLRHTVHDLAAYAVTGTRLDAPVQEYLLSLLPLWTYAAGGAGVETPEFDRAYSGDLDSLDHDWRGRLVLVMVGALGREQLASGRPVTVAQLAALASMSPDAVRLLGRKGELALSGDPLECDADEARRWLGARGVVS